MLQVELGRSNLSEKQYIIDFILGQTLGVSFNYVFSNSAYIQISDGIRKLQFADIFLNQISDHNWLLKSTLPQTPLSHLDLREIPVEANIPESSLPVFYGTPTVKYQKDAVSIGFDLFGGAFFVLSRYEEAVVMSSDFHDRFRLQDSILYKESLLERPVVNEYIEFLWANLKYLWPSLSRKTRNFRTMISCDVDHLWDRNTTSLYHMMRSSFSALFKRRSINEPLIILRRFLEVSLLKRYKADEYNTFDFMMSECEKNGLKMAFYFICGNSAGKIDGYYKVQGKRAKRLLNEINRRGHEIGIHLSYNTYLDEVQAKIELKTLKQVLDDIGIKGSLLGGRQHYLRWKTSKTAEIWDELNLIYDSTLTFAEQPGFRCGICYEFPIYHLQKRKKLKIVERPLIVMEGSLLNPRYEALSIDSAIDEMFKFKRVCKHYSGDFTLLWHNTFFFNRNLKDAFSNVIKTEKGN